MVTETRRTWNLAHYERHLMTVTLELRNWIERGAKRTIASLSFDAVTLIDGLRRDHAETVAEPLIRRILDDVRISDSDIRSWALEYVR